VSILVVELVRQGMLFGADRNVTHSVTGGGLAIQGHSQRPKVLKWPNETAIVGYVGLAQIEGRPTDEWLYSFIGRHLTPTNSEELARALVDELEAAIPESVRAVEPLVVHLGAFEQQDGHWVPKCWFIRNTLNLDYDTKADFDVSEELLLELPDRFGRFLPNKVRDAVGALSDSLDPFWFHQGYDLGTFNTLHAYLKEAFRLLLAQHPAHNRPQSLEEWTRHLRLTILTYGAYFEAFKTPFEHYVGGGVDVVSLAWPDS